MYNDVFFFGGGLGVGLYLPIMGFIFYECLICGVVLIF